MLPKWAIIMAILSLRIHLVVFLVLFSGDGMLTNLEDEHPLSLAFHVMSVLIIDI